MTDSQLIQSVTKMQEELVAALSEMSRISGELAQNHAVTKPTFKTSEEERSQVLQFLFKLQKTGITNMLSADQYIQKRFGFTKAKSEEYLFDYIDNYSELEAKFSEVKHQVVEVKKRKGPKPYSEMTPEELEEAKAKKAKKSESSSIQSDSSVSAPVADSITKVEAAVVHKKMVLKLNKAASGQEPKPKGVLIWNSFMNMVKTEMTQASGMEVSYDDVRKKAVEMKESDPASYKLFSENWSA